MIGEMLLPSLGFTPLVMIACAVAMVVLRAGASRIFFDIVGTFQATKLLGDAKSAATVLEALYIDSLMGIQESAQELADMFNALTDAVMPAAIEIENARVELEKFLDAGDDITQISDDLEDIGVKFGFAADEAFAAGARMAQLSGVLGGGATPVGTELGVMFGLISGMETEAAMQRLINLNQQTKFMTENITENMTQQERANQIRKDSIRVLDQLNTVENRSAATMQQITFVMNQFASQAHLTGESIAAMAAMSATLIEAGEEQGKGGRALRMIYARLGADTNGARTAIENLGIAVYDAEGNMRPFSELLQQLAVEYEGMNNKQQMALVQTVAGNRHYTRLIKLLENVDRVRELEFEAMVAQFPARDELNRRLESEVFLYEQAEARLKNYSGAFGEQLLPAMTRATNVQAQFFKQLNAFAEGPLGPVLTNFIFLSKTMSNFVGPTFQAILGIKGLTIAMDTQQIVMDALNGKQLKAIQTESASTASKNANVIAIKNVTNAVSAESQEKLAALQHQFAMIASDEVSAKSKQGHETQIKLMIKALKLLGVQFDVVTDKQIENNAIGTITGNTHLANSMKVTKYSMSLGALGSAFMMMGENENAMRYGMTLTTTAMALQMFQTYKSITAMIKKTESEVINTGVQEINEQQSKETAAAYGAIGSAATGAAGGVNTLTGAVGANTAAQTAGKGGLLAKLSKSGKYVKGAGYIGAAIMGVELASRFLFKTNQDVINSYDELNSGMADTELVMEYLKHSETELLAIIKDKEDAYQVAIKQNTQLGKDTAARLSNEIASAQKAYDMQVVANMEQAETIDLAKEYYDILQKQEDVMKNQKGIVDDIQRTLFDIHNMGDDSMKWIEKTFGIDLPDWANPDKETSPFLDWLTGGRISDQEKFNQAMEDFKETNIELYTFLKGLGVSTWEEADEAILQYQETVKKQQQEDEKLYGGMVNGIGEVEDAIYSFNNAREELFFGFSADRLTGDLVRQVRQQGVETLITSTEVIMTNNFNGMTTAEVASEILRLIETEGNFKGYNFSTTAG